MRQISFSRKSAPFALLLLCLLSFGALIPWLGFYWDDWPVILMTRLMGPRGFLDFYQFDRPFSAWTYLVTTPLLGTSPLPWHIFTLSLRWLTALGLWWSLRGLWPNHSRQVTWMALLFAVYPTFLQQPISVAFSQHWICYALYFLSFGAMIHAFRSQRWFYPLMGLSLLTAALHLFTMEYFLGLELLRPVALWILFTNRFERQRQRIRAVVAAWLPFLGVLFLFIVWRLFFLNLAGEDPNRPELLYSLISNPIASTLQLIQIALQDTLHTLLTVWYDTLQPALLDFGDRFALFSLGFGSLVGLITAFYLLHLQSSDEEELTDAPYSWLRQAFLLGIFALLLGPLPAWLTGDQSLQGMYGSRFALGGMFGASVLLVVALEWLTPRRISQVVLLSVLIGLAAGFHLRNANEYRWVWTKESRFYWQLKWRAPSLQPHTAIFSEGELFKYVGAYSTSAGINLLYSQPVSSNELNYWFVDLYRNFTNFKDMLVQGTPIERSFRSFLFKGASLDSLVIDYQPEEGRCLWLLDASDVDNPDIGGEVKAVLPISNFARISDQPTLTDESGLEDIFGPEPEHTWCYYYQKASLARQMGDWDTILELDKQAQDQGHSPSNLQEWLPFIEAYARTGEWREAENLSMSLVKDRKRYAPRLCTLWSQLAQDTNLPPEDGSTVKKVQGKLGCMK